MFLAAPPPESARRTRCSRPCASRSSTASTRWSDTSRPTAEPRLDALLAGLEILPPKSVDYRGTALREFDLDAALARQPALHPRRRARAHRTRRARATPSAGRTSTELLDAGIDVYTTLNVQHLESLNDVVAQITGVARARDGARLRASSSADEVELVDLPPDELLGSACKDGKVYVPEQAESAASNFFRKGNLIALRELALRRTAERVDAQMRVVHARARDRRRVAGARSGCWCASARARTRRACVRAAKRMADRLGAPVGRRLRRDARARGCRTRRGSRHADAPRWPSSSAPRP